MKSARPVVAPGLEVVPPLPLGVHLQPSLAALPFPLQAGRVRLFSRARQGLYQALGKLGLGAGYSVLVPAYHHGAEIEAYVRAGLELKWYEAKTDLAPDPAELESLVGPGVRALHLTHYLGFAQDPRAWRAWCDARGLLLIEDVAQGWLGSVGDQPLGSVADLALFSLHKSIAVPDGGAVVLGGDLLTPDREGTDGVPAMLARHGAWLARRLGPVGRLWTRSAATTDPPGADISLGEPGEPAYAVTEGLVRRLATPQVAERRRQNYRHLQAALPGRAPDPFGRDPEGASPFAFPLFVADQSRAIALLAVHGIEAIAGWPTPHPALPLERFPGAARRRAGVVLLPVHQELRATDLDRIAAAARGIPDPRLHERVFS